MGTDTTIKDTTANPAPLGLVGFGLTTILLNLANAGVFPLNAMILGMGIFVGGLAQVIAGVLESKKGNTFGTTAFTLYGVFWLSLVAILWLSKIGVADAPNGNAMGCYLALWGLFTFGMFFGTLRLNRALQVVFLSLTVLFFMLAIEKFTGDASVGKIAGYEGIFCGFSAFYAAIAQVLNEIYGCVVLPIGPVVRK